MLLYILLTIGIICFASFYMAYQIFQIVLIDAQARGIERPRFWAWLAAGGQHAEGILLYLFKRKNYLSKQLAPDQQEKINLAKQKAKVSILFMDLAVVIFLITILWT